MSLMLQENLIDRISGLDTLCNLRQINLTDNMISKIEGLGNLPMLDTIQLKRNRIGRTGGLSDVLGLLECPTLTCVDLSDNYIDDEAVLPEVWMKMPKILVIYMQGNSCTKKIKNYRKTVISSIPDLRYLDDRPVFEDDRAFAEAWARGGIEEERKERERIRKDKEEKHWKNHEAFQDMINRAREEKRQAEEAKKAAQRAIEAEGGAPEVVEEEKPVEEAAVEVKPEEDKHVEEQEDEEEPPELEEVDLEEEKRIHAEKETRQKEWLNQIKSNPKNEEKPFIPWDDECALPKPDEEAIKKRTEQLLKQTEAETEASTTRLEVSEEPEQQ